MIEEQSFPFNWVNACVISSDGDHGKTWYADDFHRLEEKIDKLLEMLGQGNNQGEIDHG